MTRLSISTSLVLALMCLPSSASQGGGGGGGGGGGPQILPPPVAPGANLITEEKRILGKLLFWEEQLSSSNDVACGTCHKPEAGGADPRQATNPGANGSFGGDDDIIGSAGIRSSNQQNEYIPHDDYDFDQQVTSRTSPSVFLAAYNNELFWDGRASSQFIDPETGQVAINSGGALESQAVEPILSSAEMGHEGRTWDQVRTKLQSVRPMAMANLIPADMAAAIANGEDYPELFFRAFGDTSINARRIAFALATYQRTLVPDQTPFDLFQQGQGNAMTNDQITGMNIFNGQARCNLCHTPPLFSDDLFHNLGIRPDQEDAGRRDVTGSFAHRGEFKTPSLRNVGLRNRFFHNGQNGDINNPPPIGGGALGQIFPLYINGGGPFGNGNLDPLLQPIGNVGPGQLAQVRDFIENALTDPRVAAAAFPFDHPRLYSDRNINGIEIYGNGVAGSGGHIPEIMVDANMTVDNPDFRLGLTNGLGGSQAFLFLIPANQGITWPLTPVGRVTAIPTILNGSGPGEGYGTQLFPIRSTPSMIGRTLDMQFWVTDPNAVNGMAKSEVARITLF